MHVVKLSFDTWIDPVHGPESSVDFTVSVAGFIGTLNATVIAVDVTTEVAPSIGLTPVTAGATMQVPALHVPGSTPTVHDVPSGATGLSQSPVAGLQLPARWQSSMGVQTTGFEPPQVPAVHVSVCVQRLPSLHPVPSGAAGLLQVPSAGLQVPAT
jgi:hypothetical protein